MKILLAVWKLVQVLLIALMHGFGWLLVVLAMFSLLRIGVFCLFGELTFFGGNVGFGPPVMVIGDIRLECITWRGAAILILFNLFLLAWGWDSVRSGRSKRGGRSKRPISPRGHANRALAATRLKLLFDTLLLRAKR